MTKIAVLLKTHIWSEHIEKFAAKIYAETKNHNIDFFILMHDENDLIYSKIINQQLKTKTFIFKEDQIKKLYTDGFYSMWLSNHWMTMWFYQNYENKYDYIWTTEYDVRISGDSSKIWLHSGTIDFMFVNGNLSRPNNPYHQYYVGGKLQQIQKYQGFMQIARFSKKLLEYLDCCFKEGENGQDELIVFSLARRGGFTMSNQFLKQLVKGVWSWQKKYDLKNWHEYNQMEKSNSENKYLAIFHPVKCID